MHGIQQIIAFVETARHGSFAGAARESGHAPSTLAKAVSRLEASLGVRLFNRTTRHLSLTADGERLFRRCEHIVGEIEALRDEAIGVRSAPSGTLRIDLPSVYGRKVVLPALLELAREHPGLSIDARLRDSMTDIVREGIDMAIRVGALRDSSLVARNIDRQDMLLVASPGYLARAGTPSRVDQLARHAAVVARVPWSGRRRPWLLAQRGRTIELEPLARMELDDGEAIAIAVTQGMGLAQLPDYMVEDQLADGRLVELLPRLRPPAIPISVVYPSSRYVPSRVRAAIARLTRIRRSAGTSAPAGRSRSA